MHTPPTQTDLTHLATMFEQERFAEALVMLDGLIANEPESAILRWHRISCLENLDRFAEVRPELDALLARNPDYVPAIIKRVHYAQGYDDTDTDDASLSEAEGEQRMIQSLRTAEAQLRRALALEPDNVDALQALSAILRVRIDAPELALEAEELLERAIALAPDNVDLLAMRANHRHNAAMRLDDGPNDDDTIQNFTGQRFSRRKLEIALADYQACHARSGLPRYLISAGKVLHNLGRFDEALAHYDQALAAMPEDDPTRAAIVEIRARSENNGAGEREEIARLLETSLVGDGKDRSLSDDIAASNMMALANAIRAGQPIAQAMEAQFDENDPDLLIATDIAQKLLQQAYEPPPELAAVDARDFPAYQRKFADRCTQEILAAGLRQIGDAEAKGLFMMLGRHVLLRFFADDSGEVGVAVFAMKPKWPGWIGFLVLLLSGKWKMARMVECVSQFEDGTHLSTQHENISPFEFGGNIRVEKLPRKTPIKDLIAHHMARVKEYKQLNPGCAAMVVQDIAGMDHRWREGQRVKGIYRKSIGYVTETELKNLLGAHYARFADKVRRQLALLAANQEASS